MRPPSPLQRAPKLRVGPAGGIASLEWLKIAALATALSFGSPTLAPQAAQAIEAYEITQRHKKEFEEATERAEKKSQQQFIEFLKWQGEYKSIKSEVLEQKLGVMEEREELRKQIKEQSQWKEKYPI